MSDLSKIFPHASSDFLKANSTIGNTRKATIVECNSKLGALGKSEAKKTNSERVHIRFTSIRKRLLDPDNLCEKFHLDLIRRCGAIEGDEPEKITLETSQRKTEKGEEEKTIIEIYQLT